MYLALKIVINTKRMQQHIIQKTISIFINYFHTPTGFDKQDNRRELTLHQNDVSLFHIQEQDYKDETQQQELHLVLMTTL